MASFSLPSAGRRLLHQYRLFCTSPAISAADASSDKASAILSPTSDRVSPSFSSKKGLEYTVKRLAKSRRFSEIETLVESQKNSPNVIHEPYLASLVHAYGCAGMLDHALRTFEQMEDLGAYRSSVSFNSLLSACNKSQNFAQVPKLFSELSDKYQIKPNKFSYGILIKSLCESGSPESAFPILEEMKSKNVEITGVTYTTLLDAFYKKGKVDEAQTIWEEMEKNGCSTDVAVYNVKIKHACNGSDGKPEEVLKLLDEMTALGLTPDTISYNYLMTSYSMNNQVEDAMKVYEDAQAKGCLGNAATFRTLLFYLCKSGDYEQALKVFQASSKRNKVPDFGTVKRLVEGLAKESKLKEAKDVIKVAKKKLPEKFVIAWKEVEASLGLNKSSIANCKQQAVTA
ncbi:small ribosomal subunit protein mL103 (rPPR7)-like [Aristolochia californica]|uniref:small ribosomal subunit protein mL103 (rPPR7)-like n=1 Tax=Aristolochia californica TaxID=171875 RepID=UPI0035D95C81